MKTLERLLGNRQSDGGRHWLFVPYDQLNDQIGPLARENPNDLGIVLIENRWQLSRRPFHRQKLALIIANLRRFALEQAERGVAVRYIVADKPYRDALRPLLKQFGPMRVMEPAERELRLDIAPLVEREQLEIIPHEGWLTTHDQFLRARPKGPPWRMDIFYKYVRRQMGVLMDNGAPVGGKFSFDPENREPWRGSPQPPDPPRFESDHIEEEVAVLIESDFNNHPGAVDLNALPTTRTDADRLWSWAKRTCLPHFGPFEDAMSSRSSGLFHTRLSALINLHRLLPSHVVAEAEKLDIPLGSKEGFIRQVLGWREFIRHVHLASDGFRRLPHHRVEVEDKPGDAGYRRWAGRHWRVRLSPQGLDGGATPCLLKCDTPLPPAYWGTESGLACLDHVVADVWREGWSHHITRLIPLCGIATMLDVNPRELADWFWVAYIDSQDWVVEPNVLGMGMFAIGDYMSTKPYVTGAAYINRMSDFCETCRFDPKSNCPLTNLYWAFLSRHRRALANNPRMRMPLATLSKRSDAKRRQDRQIFTTVRELLIQGKSLTPDVLT